MKNKKLLAPALAILLLTPAVLDMPKSYASEGSGSGLNSTSPEKVLDAKKKELAELEQEKTQTEENLGKVNEDLDKLNKEKTQTENDLNEKDIKIKSNESLIDTNTSKEKLDKKIEELDGKIDENNKSLEKAKEEGKEIQKQIDELQANDKKEEKPKQNGIDSEAEKKKAEELEEQRKKEVERAKDLNDIYNNARKTLKQVKVEHGIIEYKYKVKNEFLTEVLKNPDKYKPEDVNNYKKEVEELEKEFKASETKIKESEEAVKIAKDNQIAFWGHSNDKHTSGSLAIGKEGAKHKARSEFKNNTLSQKDVEDKIIELKNQSQDALNSYVKSMKNYDTINDKINLKSDEYEKIKLENNISEGIRAWLYNIENDTKELNKPDFYYVNNDKKIKEFVDKDYKQFQEKTKTENKIINEILELENERKAIGDKSIPYQEKRIELENQLIYYRELLQLIKNGGPKEEDPKENPKLKELTQKLLANKTNITNLENIIKNLQKELAQVKSDRDKLDSITDEDRARLREELGTLNEERKAIQAKLDEINSKVASKNQEKENFEKLLAELNDKISELKKAIDDLNIFLYNQSSGYYYYNQKSSEEKVKEIRQKSVSRLKIAYSYSVKVVDNAEYYLKTAKMPASRRARLESLIERQKVLNKKVEMLINKYQLEI